MSAVCPFSPDAQTSRLQMNVINYDNQIGRWYAQRLQKVPGGLTGSVHVSCGSCQKDPVARDVGFRYEAGPFAFRFCCAVSLDKRVKRVPSRVVSRLLVSCPRVAYPDDEPGRGLSLAVFLRGESLLLVRVFFGRQLYRSTGGFSGLGFERRCSNAVNRCSSITGTPRLCAFASLLPGSLPAKR